MTTENDRKYLWNPRVACRTLEGTAFVLMNSRLLSLNEVGTRIWGLLEKPHSVSEVTEQIVAEFDTDRDTALRDACAFVEQLVERHVLVIADAVSPSEGI